MLSFTMIILVQTFSDFFLPYRFGSRFRPHSDQIRHWSSLSHLVGLACREGVRATGVSEEKNRNVTPCCSGQSHNPAIRPAGLVLLFKPFTTCSEFLVCCLAPQKNIALPVDCTKRGGEIESFSGRLVAPKPEPGNCAI